MGKQTILEAYLLCQSTLSLLVLILPVSYFHGDRNECFLWVFIWIEMLDFVAKISLQYLN